ncbi:hypothetical protein JCM10908_004216 [Rhodotorula pacifica]|uniref:uncharacterized protein n=1 Tax=Rhodotorula pacifica TaxID=1495444 RepID=UPI0031730D2E
MAADSTAQRTVVVLFAPEAHLGAPYARRIITGAGLAVVKEEKLSGEELEEAGLDVGEGGPGGHYHAATHIAMVVEGTDAVARMRDLRAGALATECPTLRTFAAPSSNAAAMTIEILFPCLDDPTEEFPATAPATAELAATPKPFALSNAAFEARQEAAPIQPVERRLSPAIEAALAEVEAREEQQRLRKISRSSRGSTGGTPSPLASREASSTGGEGVSTPERRLFTLARSPSPEPEPEMPAAVSDEIVAEEAVEETTAQSSATEEQADEPARRQTHTPTRSRVSSALSRRSEASSAHSTAASSGFKARPAPSFASKPSIQPRMTKAAALRLGIALPPSTPRRSTIAHADSAVGPTPRPSSATPRSLAQPTIVPRLTKAAALRLGQPDATDAGTSAPRVRQSISTAERAAIDRARRQSAAGTSSSSTTTTTAPPKVEVRMSRAALLRQGLDASGSAAPRTAGGRASLSSSMSGPTRPLHAPPPKVAAAGRPSLVSADLKALREPAIAPRMTKAASLRTGAGANNSARPSLSSSRPSLSSSSSSTGDMRAIAMDAGTLKPSSSLTSCSSSTTALSRPASSTANSGTGPRKSLSIPAPPPSVPPRLNKAAELRRAKMQQGAATPPVAGKATFGTSSVKSKTLTERN